MGGKARKQGPIVHCYKGTASLITIGNDQPEIITQYTNNYRLRDPAVQNGHKIMFGGNNAKSLKLSFKTSLERLRTDYVDLLYVHWWDYDTSVEEVMHALHNLVVQGKVLYLVCNTLPTHSLILKGEFHRVYLTPLRGWL